MRKLLLIAIAAGLMLAVWLESARAMPAFARRYRLSCKTCHSPFPRLNAYGEEFVANAFQLPDAEEPAGSFVDVGDEKLSLLRDLPVAVRGDLNATYTPDDEEVETDFEFPVRLKFLSGGAIHKDISYYFYFYFSEGGEVAGVDDCFVHFNNLFGKELDIIAGQFAISDPLLKRELRLTYEDYAFYPLRVGDTSVNIMYDRGITLTYSPRAGTDLVFEIVNGNGIPDAGEGGSFDSDSFKNMFFRGSQDLFEGVRLGGYYYFGRQTNGEITNSSNIWCIDGTLAYKEIFTLDFQYHERRDNDPFFTGLDLDDVKTKAALVQGVYAPKESDSNWYMIFLYNWINSELDIYDYESVTLNFQYLLLRNARLFGEITRDIKYESTRLVGGLVFAM
jgi:hypothetical protein